MDIDEIITSAFQKSIQGEGLFIVEGNPDKNDIRVKPADQAYKENLSCFGWNINHGYQYMGIFTEEKQAQDFIETVRERIRDENGKKLF